MDENIVSKYSIGKFEELRSNYNYWSDWQEASFFAFTLVSTIGYGKVTPQTDYGKISALPYRIRMRRDTINDENKHEAMSNNRLILWVEFGKYIFIRTQ